MLISIKEMYEIRFVFRGKNLKKKKKKLLAYYFFLEIILLI